MSSPDADLCRILPEDTMQRQHDKCTQRSSADRESHHVPPLPCSAVRQTPAHSSEAAAVILAATGLTGGSSHEGPFLFTEGRLQLVYHTYPFKKRENRPEGTCSRLPFLKAPRIRSGGALFYSGCSGILWKKAIPAMETIPEVLLRGVALKEAFSLASRL